MCRYYMCIGGNMARIIDNEGNRRIIKLSSNDIISVVREYQNMVTRGNSFSDTLNILENNVIYIPEDV